MPIIRSWASSGHRPLRSATNLRRTRSQTGSESISTPSMSNTTALITPAPRTPSCLPHRRLSAGGAAPRLPLPGLRSAAARGTALPFGIPPGTLADDQRELTGLRHQPAGGVPYLRVFLEVAAFQVPGQGAEGEPAGGRAGPQVHGELYRGHPAQAEFQA